MDYAEAQAAFFGTREGEVRTLDWSSPGRRLRDAIEPLATICFWAEPAYDAYGAIVARAGGVLRPVPVRFPDWRPDPEELRRAVTDRTRVILVNSPHNPTGAVLDRDVLVDLYRGLVAIAPTAGALEALAALGG